MKRALDVIHTGPLATVQDVGRPGHAALGVGVSGAADPDSLTLANRALGNPEGAAAIEVTLGGLHVRCRGGVFAAVTGAPAALTVDGRAEAPYSIFHIPDGAELRMAPPPSGLRSYLARARRDLGPPPHPAPLPDVLPVRPPRPGDIELRAAVVASADVGRAAQARPGQRLRFRPHPAPDLRKERP